MPKQRSELERAAGQLVLAAQREWERDFDDGLSSEHDAVMGAAHGLLQAAKSNSIDSLLAGRSVAEHLGPSWVGRHPNVIPVIKTMQLLIKGKHAV